MTCNTSLSHAGMVFRLDIDRSMSPLQVTIIKLNSGYYTDTFIISQNFNQNNMERRGGAKKTMLQAVQEKMIF